MKTTIDLPDDLVRQLKMRALLDGRKVKELAADLLRTGLASSAKPKGPPQPKIVRDKKSGLPMIQCPRSAPRGQPTPEQIDAILLNQEIERAYGIG